MPLNYQTNYFFLTLIKTDVFNSLLDLFDINSRDQVKLQIIYWLELCVLDSIATLLSPAKLPGFIDLYARQPTSPQLLEYLDTCPQTSRLALREVINRALFGLHTSLFI